MTRIAVLADIHGNLPALEAVMADVARAAPDHVIVNGDIVNRGPQSRECWAAVRAAGWPVVLGNHEEYVSMRRAGEVPLPWQSDFWLSLQVIAESFSAEEAAAIRALPRDRVLALPGLPAIRVVHGSMRALNDGLGGWMSDAELLDAIQGAPEPVVIGAHTHRPFDRRVGDRWVLNCGSVGAPYNGNPDAQYLILTAHDGTWTAEFRHVAYDRGPVYAAWEDTSYFTRSMSAQIFRYELETATYQLGPYFQFCEAHGLDRNTLAAVARYRRAAGVTPAGWSGIVGDEG